MSEEELLIQQLFENEKLTEKQKKIIIAAIDLFSEKGYAATSTSEIATKAGVAEGTIFRHYKTKKVLLLSIVAPLMTKLIGPYIINDFNKVLDRQFDRVEDFLRATIENRRDLMRRMLPVLKIVLQELPFQPELREQFIDQVAKTLLARISDVIKDYQERGQLKNIRAETIARLAITSILGYLLSRYVLFPQMEWDDELEIDRLIQFIMHGLAAKPEDAN